MNLKQKTIVLLGSAAACVAVAVVTHGIVSVLFSTMAMACLLLLLAAFIGAMSV